VELSELLFLFFGGALGSRREDAVESSIYWRGPAEQAYYREMQRTARSYGFRSWNGYDE